MVDLALINFIVYNFLQVPLRSVVIFNCWHMETQHAFSEMAHKNFLYAQYVNMDQAYNLTHNFERRFFLHKRPTLGVFLDMNCENSLEILNKTSRLRLFNGHYHWLIYDHAANMEKFQRFFVHANLSVDADLSYVSLNTKNNSSLGASYVLYDVYNNGHYQGGSLNMTIDREITCNVSGCRLAQYLSKLHLRPKYGNRERLTDITMRVATVITKIPLTLPEPELLAFLESIIDPHVDSIARFGWKLTMLVQQVLGCNMSFSYYNGWSRSSEVGGGTVGAMIAEQADFTSSPFLNTAARLKYLSVIAETGGFRSICLFRTPRNSGMYGGVFLTPFSTTVWLLFGLLLGLTAVFLWRTFHVEHRRMRCLRGASFEPSLLATCLMSFGAACIQGSYLIPHSIGGRIAFFVLSLISFVMYNYYTSIVVSSLLGAPIKSNIKTMTQLADSNLDVGLEPLPFTFVYLNASQLPDIRRFVRRKIESKRNPASLWMPVEDGLKRVRDNPGYVFVFEASSGFSLVEKLYKPHEICDLNEIMLRTDKSLYTQLHKNSTYKELIRLKEMRMLETGVYAKLHRYWVRTHLNCFANNFVIDVGMEYCAPLFFLLLSAYILVFLILMLEIGFKRYMDSKLKVFHRH